MDVSILLELLFKNTGLTSAFQDKNWNGINLSIPEAAKPFVIASLSRYLNRPITVITAQPENSKKLFEQISLWDNSRITSLFPEPDALPYQKITSDISTEVERLRVLTRLVSPVKKPFILVIPMPAVLQKVPVYKNFKEAVHTITTGMKIDPFVLFSRWDRMGYRQETIVDVPGTMSRRGGIIDIFPPSSDMPVRFEFAGNTIESMRYFDPISQRSLSRAESIIIPPATELFLLWQKTENELEQILEGMNFVGCTTGLKEQFRKDLSLLTAKQKPAGQQLYGALFNSDSILKYLPDDSIIILDEPPLLKNAAQTFIEEAEELRSRRIQHGELPANFPVPYNSWENTRWLVQEFKLLQFTEFDSGNTVTINPGFEIPDSYGGQLQVFIHKIAQLKNQKKRVIIASYQSGRLEELLDDGNIIASRTDDLTEIPPACSITLIPVSFAGGWVFQNDTYLITDAEIFGFVKQRRLVRKRPAAHHKLYRDFNIGDYVVHVDHGIGKYAGITLMGNGTSQKEYMIIQYAAGDRLYVPADQVDRVTRYTGTGEKPPALTRLGTAEWHQTRKRVKEAVEIVARDLLELYATREVVSGFAFSPDTVWQQEFESSFPYVETPDQLEAVRQVKADMEKPKPMDRLVCGDVGYGKTEIAIRAAFKAVMDGKQVAVLVPTTVLAQQHLITFKQRMEAFPITIDMLSRFRSKKEQKDIIEKIADGSLDICIGTHRLIQKDVHFKNLGLLIIDEEQRFGVAHKEYLKKMRKDIHVLTLSATPIPRTLHMALTGIRDMSTIETPPEDRLPIKTFVGEYADNLVREAILREMERNGQVFFVHNRVRSIYQIADQLRTLVPEARIAVSHGQMSELELEKVMTDFLQGKSDVLVCSTIIESGLDMPNVNTIVINNADKFGLTQLYQLRGRIGRGGNIGYAYLLYDKNKKLTPIAWKRLQTIYEATELGAGFGIAMKDLEIRGAGTLLGTKQSGFISAVGFDLYLQMLEQAVEEIKSRGKPADVGVKKQPSLPAPTIDLPLPAFIPESYIGDADVRLNIYREIARLNDVSRVDRYISELRDRFGPLPDEVRNLLYAVKVKLLASQSGIESVSSEDGHIVLRRFQGMSFDGKIIQPYLKYGLKLGKSHLYINFRLVKEWPRVLENILRALVSK